MAHTPIPIQVMAHLHSLSGEEFKAIGAICYLQSNANKATVTIEQIERWSGIPPSHIKSTLQRLIRRGWLLQTGNTYQLAFQQEVSTPPPAITHYDPTLGIRPPRATVHLLYPEGPWLGESGLLDAAFVRDRAEVWRTGNHYSAQAYGAMAIEDVMGAVCKHYAKPENHGNLEIDWHSYCTKNQRYLTNIQQRLQSGAQIQADEQEQVLQKLYLSQKSATSPYEQTTLPFLDTPTLEPILPTPPQPALVAVGQTAAPLVESIASSPLSLSSVLATSFSDIIKPIPALQTRRPTPISRVDKLRLWLADPILRQEATKAAIKDGYELIYNEEGLAIDIAIEPPEEEEEEDF
jgi:hypothetical protein